MNLIAGKYYTLDIEEFKKYNKSIGYSPYFGIDPKDIDIFENNKKHKCVFCKKLLGDNFAMYFEGQQIKGWRYREAHLLFFKEYNPIIQEEMEI